MLWYVLYTKPRTEIKSALELEKLGVEVFCPVITEIRQWSDRKKKVKVPLFKSYIFVKIEEKISNVVFEIPGIIRYLFWLGKRATVRDEEIEVISNWLEGDKVDEARIETLCPGDMVTISSGAFKDRSAVIKEVGKKRMRLILPQMGFAVEVKTSDVLGL